ncbi:MAG: LolA-related protein [Dyella sp.]
MISGKTLAPWLCLSIALSASASTPPADGSVSALIASLGRPAPARTPFAEARFMRVLDQPLVVSGELAWLGGDRLERTVTAPHVESAQIADGVVTQQREGRAPRRFSLQRAPQLQLLLDSFVALLGGDAARLQQAFTIELHGDAAGAWSLLLTPRDAQLARSVASIRIDGQAQQPRCMSMREPDGDLAVDLLGSLAAHMPAAPSREALAQLCQARD